MKLGSNGVYVDDAIAVFRNISQQADFPSGTDAEITDLDAALAAAWEAAYGKEELTWSDIRSREMRGIWAAVYESREFGHIESAIQSLIDETGKILVESTSGSTIEAICEDILSDMQCITYARAVNGRSCFFFEELLEAYRKGKWPCGWNGAYPQGCVIAFAGKQLPGVR